MKNEVREALALTPNEWEAIRNRLGEPDALGEVFSDEYAPQDTEEVADLLERGKMREASEISIALVNDILRDCIEGSTYAAAAVGETSATYNAAVRSLKGAAKKVAKWLGVPASDLTVPLE